MPTKPTDPLWVWDEISKRYRKGDTGQYIGVSGMQTLRDEFIAQQKNITDKLAEQLRNKDITMAQWEKSMVKNIKQTHIDLYSIGAGGRNSLSQKDWGRIGAMCKSQYGSSGYLKGFYNDIANGNLSEGQIAVRSRMYVNAANEALWKGITNDLPTKPGQAYPLPFYPGDGSTECMTNCLCQWDIVNTDNGVDAYWRLSNAEHCPTCTARSYDPRYQPFQIQVM
jgi:hypothetical protein